VVDLTVEKGKGSLIHQASGLRSQAAVCFGMLITSVSLLLFQKLIKVIGVWRLDRIVGNSQFQIRLCVAVCCLEEMDREGLRAVMERLVILRGESLCDTL